MKKYEKSRAIIMMPVLRHFREDAQDGKPRRHHGEKGDGNRHEQQQGLLNIPEAEIRHQIDHHLPRDKGPDAEAAEPNAAPAEK